MRHRQSTWRTWTVVHVYKTGELVLRRRRADGTPILRTTERAEGYRKVEPAKQLTLPGV